LIFLPGVSDEVLDDGEGVLELLPLSSLLTAAANPGAFMAVENIGRLGPSKFLLAPVINYNLVICI